MFDFHGVRSDIATSRKETGMKILFVHIVNAKTGIMCFQRLCKFFLQWNWNMNLKPIIRKAIFYSCRSECMLYSIAFLARCNLHFHIKETFLGANIKT